MITIESILYSLLGGLVGLKIYLLGLAAVLFVYSLTKHNQQRKTPPARPPRLDIYV